MADESKTAEETVSVAELTKSIESLQAFLNAENVIEPAIEKSFDASLGTNGGLADEVQGGEPLDPNLAEGGKEETELLEDPMAKSADAHAYVNAAATADHEAHMAKNDEAFAKSLVDAFAEQDAVVEGAQNSEFLKSLVLCQIEGLSIANSEMQKALVETETRLASKTDEKFGVLAKALIAIAESVKEMSNIVTAIDNAPARGRKSVAGTAVIEKAFGADAPKDNALSKAAILAEMQSRVEAGTLDAFQLVRYESAGSIDAGLLAEIQAKLGGK